MFEVFERVWEGAHIWKTFGLGCLLGDLGAVDSWRSAVSGDSGVFWSLP